MYDVMMEGRKVNPRLARCKRLAAAARKEISNPKNEKETQERERVKRIAAEAATGCSATDDWH